MKPSHKLTAIKLFHTLIWAFFASVIFFILFCGITGRITIYTWIGIALVFAESLVLVLFKMYCPLTLVARKYSDSTADNFDIFLPKWLARHNKSIFGTLFFAGLIAVLLQEML